MVYNAKFEVLTCSLSGIPVRVLLNKREPAVSIANPDLISVTGFRIKVKDTDIVTESINGSELSITFVSDINFNSQILYTEDERDWRIDIYFNGDLYWSGFVLPEGFSEPYDNGQYDISLRATDTLGNLKEISYQDNSLYKGFDTDKNIVVKCLAKTGLTLPIVIGINVFENQMSSADCPLNQSSINQNRFVDKDNNAFSCHEVLRSILERYGAKIVLAKGAWYIVNTLEATKGNVPAWVYDYTGAFINKITINDVITSGATTDEAPILDRTHDISRAKAFKSSMAYYQYGFVPNAAYNGDFNLAPVAGFLPGWQKLGGVNAGYAVSTETDQSTGNTITTGYSLVVYDADTSIGQMVRSTNPIQVRANEKVTISFEMIVYNLGAPINDYELQLIIIDNGGRSYSKDGWKNYGVPYGLKLNGAEIANNKIFSVNFEIPAGPTDYQLYFAFVQVYRKSGNNYSPRETHFDNLNISVSVADAVLTPSVGEYIRLTQPKNLTYSGEPILLLHSDEPSNLRTSQILVNGNPTTQWSRSGFGLNAENKPLLLMVADSVLRLNSRPKNILDAKLGSKEIISPISLFQINQISGNYLLLSGEFDLLNEEYKLILFEGINDAVSIITPYESGTDTGNLKDKTGTSIGQPGGINNPPSPTYDFSGYVKKWETWDDKLIVSKWLKAKSYILPTAVDTDPTAIGWQIYIDENGTGGGGTPAPGGSQFLSTLLDVQLSNIANGQALVYDSGLNKWINQNFSIPNLTNYHRYAGFGTDANNIAEHTSTFTYANNAPNNGTLMHFGANGYGTQFNTNYGNGSQLHFRTRNGDIASWNPWFKIWSNADFSPSVQASGSTIVQRDANGYIFNSYINTTDDVQGGSLGYVVGKLNSGDNYHRSFTVGAVQSWLGLGNLAYVNNSSISLQYVTDRGNVTTNPINIGYDGVGTDSYGIMSVTRGTSSNYSYFGMTRWGNIGWGIGIDTSNRIIFGTNSTAANNWTITSIPHAFDASGNANHSGRVSANDYRSASWYYTNGNAGIYSMTYSSGLNPTSPSVWQLYSDISGAVSLAFSTTGGNIRGSVYADNANNIGFLGYDGNWGLRMDSGKSIFVAGNVTTSGSLNVAGASYLKNTHIQSGSVLYQYNSDNSLAGQSDMRSDTLHKYVYRISDAAPLSWKENWYNSTGAVYHSWSTDSLGFIAGSKLTAISGGNGATTYAGALETRGVNAGITFHYPAYYAAPLYMDSVGSLVWSGPQFQANTIYGAGAVRSAGWLYSNGNAGWYNETYGGGMYMLDSTYIRTYGSKILYVNNNIISSTSLIAQSGQVISESGGFKSTNYRGLVGDYDTGGTTDKIIWTIGDGWNTIAGHYGLGYSYSNGIFGAAHQLVGRHAGGTTFSLNLTTGGAYFTGMLYATGGLRIPEKNTSGNITGNTWEIYIES